jgi:hypothetical protein
MDQQQMKPERMDQQQLAERMDRQMMMNLLVDHLQDMQVVVDIPVSFPPHNWMMMDWMIMMVPC